MSVWMLAWVESFPGKDTPLVPELSGDLIMALLNLHLKKTRELVKKKSLCGENPLWGAKRRGPVSRVLQLKSCSL